MRGGGGRGGGVLAAAAGASTQKFGGEDATRQMGALIALMMAGSSSPMMAAETYDATTRELIRNADKIQARYGVNVMSTTEEGQLRSDIVEAILEIGKKASAPGGGGEAGLLEVLPAEGIRGVAMALDPAWRDAIRKILAVQASTADMFRDAQARRDGRGPGRGRGGGRGGRGGGAPAASTAVSRGHDDQRQLAG